MAHRICAWCGKILGPATTAQDTHGICPECTAKLLRKNGMMRCDHCHQYGTDVAYRGGIFKLCLECEAELRDDARSVI